MKVLVLSVFEGGYQPVTALSGFTALYDADVDVAFHDVYVNGISESDIGDEVSVIMISIPLFDSLMSGAEIAKRLRAWRPDIDLVFFGQYATINSDLLVRDHGNYAIVGEWEQPLVALIDHLCCNDEVTPKGVVSARTLEIGETVLPYRSRDHFHLLNREAAPPLRKYPQQHINKLLGRETVVGGLESTRGCHHRCTYCSVFAAYDGKVFLSPIEHVMSDVDNLIEQGMEHLTFIDADFFNSKRQSMEVMRRLNDRHPELTYDITTRVDHVLEHCELMHELARRNVRILTSALEFPNQLVLDEVYKEMTVPMIEEAIERVRDVGIVLNPTFIMFNPWVDLEDIVIFHDFIARNDLEDLVDPIQYETRLHLYKGSPLLKNPTIRALPLQERMFHYDWSHPDPRMDELFLASVTPPEEVDGFKRCCLKC